MTSLSAAVTPLLSYEPSKGFFLETSFSFSDEVIEAVGEYLVNRNAYYFYPTSYTTGEMAQGGVLRPAVRLEIRVTSPMIWVAEAYTHINGRETLVQTFRFTRKS